MRNGIIFFFFLLFPLIVWGQDSLYRQSSNKRAAASKLSKSLESSKSEEEIAADYLQLARELVSQKEYSRAENYFSQAISLYNKGKNKELLSAAYRELAKTQELQQKSTEAIANYTRASQVSQVKATIETNLNDANRLKASSDLARQIAYIQSNIDHFNSSQNQSEAAEAYQQMAEVKLKMDDKEGALEEYENALKNVKDIPKEAVKIKEEMAKTYVADEKYDKAIDINQELVKEAQIAKDPQAEISQRVNLSKTYFEANEEKKGLTALQEAYDLAMQSGQTMQAKSVLQELARNYLDNKNQTAALRAYADFIHRLDTVIRNDSTLIDDKFFQLHEDRITRLEKERALQSELIRKSNLFNYILIGFIAVILISLALIVRALYSISRKNKKIALQSLRREMNPHFIFNSLNSVNHFIAQNNELEANRYLASYSRLMRNMMENSNKDFIVLAVETEQLREYLELEQMRFRDKFTYEISVDEALDPDALCIPNMLIQPQLENAIWHGLRYKEKDGRLILAITLVDNTIRVTVDDNGIGLKQSRELKTKHQKQHQSRGLTNTQERINLLNRLYHLHITMDIAEKENGDEGGVTVTLLFPSLNKTQMTDEHPF